MIPAPLFDHHATVWRYRELRTAALRNRERQWSKVATARRIGVLVKAVRERRDDTGAGERTTGEYAGVVNARVDVCEGDVLEVYDGPTSPINLKVDGRDVVGGMTAELVLVPFVGELAS